MNDINENNIIAVMDLFVAIDKLLYNMPADQAIDAMDKYLKTGDMEDILSYNIRDFIIKTNLREKILPIINGRYNHLYDYLNEFCSISEKKL